MVIALKALMAGSLIELEKEGHAGFRYGRVIEIDDSAFHDTSDKLLESVEKRLDEMHELTKRYVLMSVKAEYDLRNK